MDIISDLTNWQYVVAVASIVACFMCASKNKVILTKIIAMLGLTLLVVLQLGKSPVIKETPLDSKIRQEREALAVYAQGESAPEGLLAITEKLGALNVAKTRDLKEEVSPVLAELGEVKIEDAVAAEKVGALIDAWKSRMSLSAEEIEKKISELNAKKDMTAADKEEVATLEGMLTPWYNKLPLKFGLDLVGGTEVRIRLLPDTTKLDRLEKQYAELEADTANKEKNAAKLAEMQKSITQEKAEQKDNFSNAAEVIRSRLNSSGLEEIAVSMQGNDKLLIQMPGMSSADAQAIINRLKKLGQLEFRLTIPASGEGANNELYSAISAAGGAEDRLNYSRSEGRFLKDSEILINTDGEKTDAAGETLYDWMHDEDGRGHVLPQEVLLTGEYISWAKAAPDPESPGMMKIDFRMTTVGSLLFGTITRTNIGRQLAVILDGKLKSAPVIRSEISTQGSISGSFTPQEARDLEIVLKNGSLKTMVMVESENTVGPSLGADSIRSGVKAMGIGFIAVLLFMLLYYRAAGLITDIILFINMMLIIAILSAFDATLTLPGIAGLILTVGMAVDANVLVFERIREERERGNTLARSIQLGYERAFVTIVDANVTTFVTALILHQFGTEAVKGFALTLIFGIICSVFTSLVLTRICFEALLEYNILKDLKMGRFFKRPNINFAALRRPAMVLSLICIVIGMFFVVKRGNENLSQEFNGGFFAELALTEKLAEEDFEKKLQALREKYPDIKKQSFGQVEGGKYGSYQVRTGEAVEGGEVAAKELRDALVATFPLEKNGLIVAVKQDSEKSTPKVAVYKAELSVKKAISPDALKNLLVNNTSLKNIEVQAGTSATDLIIFAGVPVLSVDGKVLTEDAMSNKVREQIQFLRNQKLISFTEPFPLFSSTGASVASEMISKAIMALVFSMVVIFIYIWLRFQFKVSFGAGAVVALAHDVLFTIGALAIVDELGIMNGQISLVVVAALLTLVGYSLNDTIVVFDRIRENLQMGGGDIKEVINKSINQTLSRTVITSITTLLVVVALLWLGGDVIRGFAFALFIGIFVGTYSSVFIASPILIEFTLMAKNRREKKMAALANDKK